jgi:hypothetical protein
MAAKTFSRGDYEMSVQNSVVAVYPTYAEADQAVKELQRGGFVDVAKAKDIISSRHPAQL